MRRGAAQDLDYCVCFWGLLECVVAFDAACVACMVPSMLRVRLTCVVSPQSRSCLCGVENRSLDIKNFLVRHVRLRHHVHLSPSCASWSVMRPLVALLCSAAVAER